MLGANVVAGCRLEEAWDIRNCVAARRSSDMQELVGPSEACSQGASAGYPAAYRREVVAVADVAGQALRATRRVPRRHSRRSQQVRAHSGRPM